MPSAHAASEVPAAYQAFEILPGDASSGMILLADHATNRLPAEYGSLGLPALELERHIGYDIGIEALTRALHRVTGAPAVMSCFSRLLIDPNRGADDPTLIMRLSDGAVVPGNARVDAAEREYRLGRFWRPYHAAIDRLIGETMRAGPPPMLVSLHSFTPVWRGTPRPWHVGILWDNDPRLAGVLLETLGRDPTIVVGDNEPYTGILKGDTMYQHGTRRGLAHAIVEVRQDLIADEDGVAQWAERLAAVLAEAVARPDMHEIMQFGSKSGPVEPIPAEGSSP